jgi:hypothetical protein
MSFGGRLNPDLMFSPSRLSPVRFGVAQVTVDGQGGKAFDVSPDSTVRHTPRLPRPEDEPYAWFPRAPRPNTLVRMVVHQLTFWRQLRTNQVPNSPVMAQALMLRLPIVPFLQPPAGSSEVTRGLIS